MCSLVNQLTTVALTGKIGHLDLLKSIVKTSVNLLMKSLEQKLKQHSLRYSVLLELSYFNPIQYTVIDVMHNMYLGTGKHLYRVWNDKNLLSKADLAKIEYRIKLFHVPSDCGRVPFKISSLYGAFTAEYILQ